MVNTQYHFNGSIMQEVRMPVMCTHPIYSHPRVCRSVIQWNLIMQTQLGPPQSVLIIDMSLNSVVLQYTLLTTS